MKSIIFIILSIFIFTSSGFLGKEFIPGKGIIFLDFDGYKAEKYLWEMYDSFDVSGLNYYQKKKIQDDVIKYFKEYDVTVTTDDSLFYTYPQHYRIRCVITKSLITILYNYWGVFMSSVPIQGKGYLNSLKNGDTTAAVVSLFDLDSTYIGIAGRIVAHEVGHSLGLYHKVAWKNGLYHEYDPGDSLFAPLMGMPKDSKYAGWTKGLDDRGFIIDDDSVISKTWRRLSDHELKLMIK